MRFLVLPAMLMALSGCSEIQKLLGADAPEAAAPVEAPAPAPPEPVTVPADLPALAATLSETPHPSGLENGGSIDVVTVDSAAGTVTVYGWVQVKSGEPAPELKLYAPGALSAGPISRRVREDVSAALNDVDLLFSGFDLKIQVAPDMPLTELCITTNDSTYGERLLVIQPGAALTCSSQADPAAATE
jgi:hypothetical protein